MMKFEDFIAMEEEQELVASETKREEEDTGEDGQGEEVRQELVDGEFEQWEQNEEYKEEAVQI